MSPLVVRSYFIAVKILDQTVTVTADAKHASMSPLSEPSDRVQRQQSWWDWMTENKNHGPWVGHSVFPSRAD